MHPSTLLIPIHPSPLPTHTLHAPLPSPPSPPLSPLPSLSAALAAQVVASDLIRKLLEPDATRRLDHLATLGGESSHDLKNVLKHPFLMGQVRASCDRRPDRLIAILKAVGCIRWPCEC